MFNLSVLRIFRFFYSRYMNRKVQVKGHCVYACKIIGLSKDCQENFREIQDKLGN